MGGGGIPIYSIQTPRQDLILERRFEMENQYLYDPWNAKYRISYNPIFGEYRVERTNDSLRLFFSGFFRKKYNWKIVKDGIKSKSEAIELRNSKQTSTDRMQMRWKRYLAIQKRWQLVAE